MQWRHKDKPKHWIVGRYFGKFNKFRNDRWVFGDRDSGVYLVKFSWTAILCRAKTHSPSLSWCFALLRLLSGTR